ncbi:MAG: CotH kinase family protein [Clostridia bacterium]|nr:CotH kinase family protein [Clostridia bacterium]
MKLHSVIRTGLICAALAIVSPCAAAEADIQDMLINEYGTYSFEDILKDHIVSDEYDEYDTDDDDAEDDEDIEIAAQTYKYYFEDGVFSFDMMQNGKQVIALYKDGQLVSSVIGKEIYVNDKDFDTLKVMLWSDFKTLMPVTAAIRLSYQEVMDAPDKSSFEPRHGDIPNVYLTGDMTEMTKENKVTLKIKYESDTGVIEGYVSAKWQGNAALKYPKKNFAIKLYKDEALSKKQKVGFKDWDKSNNYVLKANYIDATSARNIVSARLYKTLPDTYLQNGAQGVVDGFPVRLYVNDEFYGLYTWNKPKKGWVFGMEGDNPKELLYFSNYALGSGLFQRKYSADRYWELVYPDEHSSDDEFDRVTEFIATSSDKDFKSHIEEYMDLNSLLNYYVFSQVILNCDGLGKNMNMATYDGKLWYVRPYDLDATFGLEWYGNNLKAYDMDMTDDMRNSALWKKLEDNFAQEIYDRYVLLRNNQLREDRIIAEFEDLMGEIGDDLYKENLDRWTGTPGNTYMLDQIKDYLKVRYEFLDTFMKKFNNAE